jgi:hypothetical protein
MAISVCSQSDKSCCLFSKVDIEKKQQYLIVFIQLSISEITACHFEIEGVQQPWVDSGAGERGNTPALHFFTHKEGALSR